MRGGENVSTVSSSYYIFSQLVKVSEASEKAPFIFCSPVSLCVFAPCRDIDWKDTAERVTGVLARGCSNASLHAISSLFSHTEIPLFNTPSASDIHAHTLRPERGTVPHHLTPWFHSGTLIQRLQRTSTQLGSVNYPHGVLGCNKMSRQKKTQQQQLSPVTSLAGVSLNSCHQLEHCAQSLFFIQPN